MTEPLVETQHASDGYALHVLVWPAASPLRGRVVVIHGVQSHSGWYHNLGRRLSEAGYEAHFPDRRGSGANQVDRGHASTGFRLVADIAERLKALRDTAPAVPIVLAGISWGGKTVVLTAADHSSLVDLVALICPGLQPRVGVTLGERLRIAAAFVFQRRMRFSIPLSDPALFTASPVWQRFIANDPLSLREATAGLLAASTFIDLRVRRALRRIHQPVLLMLAGHDRIVDNTRTRADFDQIPSSDKQVIDYPEGHHTLEFDADPDRYAQDLIDWLNSRSAANPALGQAVRQSK